MKLVIVCLILAVALPAFAQDSFVVHSVNNCSGSGVGVVRTLSAGDHALTLTGAMSNWNYDAANGGLSWLTWVVMTNLTTGEQTSFSAPGGRQATATAAQAMAAGVVFPFTLAEDATMSFHFLDTPCGDNRGSVTVHLDDPAVASEGASWGMVKVRYR